jgi:hypothetical protein
MDVLLGVKETCPKSWGEMEFPCIFQGFRSVGHIVFLLFVLCFSDIGLSSITLIIKHEKVCSVGTRHSQM